LSPLYQLLKVYIVFIFGGTNKRIYFFKKFLWIYFRATAKEIYATLHLVCDEDVLLSTCTNNYSRDIQKILKSYCIRYFTLQFEYVTVNQSNYRCVHGLHRQRRGHTLDESMKKLVDDV
jgi:hypothetical protein